MTCSSIYDKQNRYPIMIVENVNLVVQSLHANDATLDFQHKRSDFKSRTLLALWTDHTSGTMKSCMFQ